MMRRQSGFAYIAAVVFLVVIAGIAVALLRLTDTQQTTVNQALLGARAGLTARRHRVGVQRAHYPLLGGRYPHHAQRFQLCLGIPGDGHLLVPTLR